MGHLEGQTGRRLVGGLRPEHENEPKQFYFRSKIPCGKLDRHTVQCRLNLGYIGRAAARYGGRVPARSRLMRSRMLSGGAGSLRTPQRGVHALMLYASLDATHEALMSDPLSRVITRVAYGASQLPRVAWYVGHSPAVRRLSGSAQRRDGKRARPRSHTDLPVPDRRRLYADMAILLQQDLANIEAGYYPLPADHDGSLMTLLHRSRLFFDDLPAIHRRRNRARIQRGLISGTRRKRPRYYLQNFHFQSGGWMTDNSATVMTRKSRCSLTGPPMRRVGKRCRSFMRSSLDGTSAN